MLSMLMRSGEYEEVLPGTGVMALDGIGFCESWMSAISKVSVVSHSRPLKNLRTGMPTTATGSSA